MTKRVRFADIAQRYALTGGALGLYFGLFFRPVREPNFLFAIGLALLIALVTLGLRLWRGYRPSVGEALQALALNFVKAALVLAVFEARHVIYEWGGRWGTTVMTTAAGALAGLYYAYEQTS